MTGERTIEESKMDREMRRAEGRRRKKKLIEESGGIRPRKLSRSSDSPSADPNKSSIATTTSNNNRGSTISSSSSHPTKKDAQHVLNKRAGSQTSTTTKTGGSQQQPRHRFGRVMDSAPCLQRPRFSTLSIAVPGSIVANCQTKELRTHLVGQIARAATIFHVDEIVVYDDKLSRDSSSNRHFRKRRDTNPNTNSYNDKDSSTAGAASEKPNDDVQKNDNHHPATKFDPQAFFARVLQYCETPQYLRRHFFPMHPDLQFAGLLSPVDAPHHVRADDFCPFREGVVLDKAIRSGGCLVSCGVPHRPVEIATKLQAGIRCTVKIDPFSYKKAGQLKGEVVSPSAPREHDGTYWGYTTRVADSIKTVLDDCPFEGGYDLKIGTSERGDSDIDDPTSFSLPHYQHAIVVFGGVAGIEECVDAEESLRLPGSESRKLFDVWLNVAKYQGSRTIRTEEAVLIGLAKLNPVLMKADAGTSTVGEAHGNTNKRQTAADNMDRKRNHSSPDDNPAPIEFEDKSVSEESSEEE